MIAPTYLAQRNGNYYFRIRIPSDLSRYFQTDTICVSQFTKQFGIAVRVAKALASLAKQKFRDMRYALMNNEVLNEILHGKSVVQNPSNGKTVAIDWMRYTTEMANGTKVELEIDHGDPEAELKVLREVLSATANVQGTQQVQAAPSATLRQAITQYVATKESGGTIQEKGLNDVKAKLELLISFFGEERDPKTIKLLDAESFKSLLMKLPPNRSKTKAYQGLTLKDIANLGHKPQSATTVKDTLQCCSSFFQWCIKADFVDKNYFANMKVKGSSTKVSQQRQRWSKSELSQLFSSDFFTKPHGNKHAYYYWLPLLGLYTGARLNELAQLRTEDIKQEGNIWYLDLNSDYVGKKLKTVESKRKVPIHKRLIDLGFLCFVKSRPENDWLFTGLLTKDGKVHRDGLQTMAGKWFQRMRKQLGLNPVFHSFRHTVADELKQSNVTEQQAASLLGHKMEGMTYGRYGKELSLGLLAKTVDILNFDCVTNNVCPWNTVNS